MPGAVSQIQPMSYPCFLNFSLLRRSFLAPQPCGISLRFSPEPTTRQKEPRLGIWRSDILHLVAKALEPPWTPMKRGRVLANCEDYRRIGL